MKRGYRPILAAAGGGGLWSAVSRAQSRQTVTADGGSGLVTVARSRRTVAAAWSWRRVAEARSRGLGHRWREHRPAQGSAATPKDRCCYGGPATCPQLVGD